MTEPFLQLGEIAELNPETLGAKTPPDLEFGYIDLSSVSRGFVDTNLVSRYRFRDAPSRARRIVRSGDVLFGTVRPQLQSHARLKDEGDVASTGFCVVRPRVGVSDGSFISHFLLSDEARRQAARCEVGSSYPAVTERDVASFRLPKFSLEEQQRIAGILDTIHEAIQATERVIAKLEASLAGIIRAQSHFEHPSTALGHLASKMTNGFVGTATPFYTTAEAGGVPYLYGTNVRPNALEISGMRHVQPSFHARQVKSRLMPGDLLTVQSGHIGTTCVVPDRLGEANCHALIITRVDQAVLRSRFISEFINSPLGMSQMRRLFVGSTILHINVKDLQSYRVPIPPIEEQDRFLEHVDSARERISTERSALEKIVRVQTGLAADLLSGRVRTVAA